MSQRLFIRLSCDPSAAVSWLRASEAGLPLGSVMNGALEQAAAEALQHSGTQTVVLAPASEVVFARAAVPGLSRARAAQAVPYALEEQLAVEVEQLHFALGRRDEDGRINTAVVSRARMQDWLERLNAGGVQSAYLISEVQALPLVAGAWSALHEAGTVTIRTGAQQGLAADADNLEVMLRTALREAGADKPARVHIFDGDRDLPLAPPHTTEDGVELVAETCHTHPLLLFAKNFDAQTAINLLQGDYSRREQLGKLWRPWRAAAALFAAWLVLEIGMTIFDTVRLVRAQHALEVHVEQLYRTTFPDARKVVNVRVQMQRRLDELRASSGGGADFLNLVAASGAALRDNPSISLRGMIYKERQLDLDLAAKDLQALDQLKQRLTQSALAVDIQSASAKEGKVEGRLQIRRQP